MARPGTPTVPGVEAFSSGEARPAPGRKLAAGSDTKGQKLSAKPTWILHTCTMRKLRQLLVDGLEVACRATRFLEWMPGWSRVYHCGLARWSNRLDERWGTGRWPVHGSVARGRDEWEVWFEGVSDTAGECGHWHAW